MRGSFKKIGAGFMILCTLLACSSVLDSGGLTVSEDSCPSTGDRAYNGNMWKLAREFRRRLSRIMKRVHLQDELFKDGLKQGSKLVHDKSVADIYDLKALDNLGVLKVTIVSAAHLHDTDQAWGKIDAASESFFCRCYIEGKADSTTFETPKISGSLSPVWDFEHTCETYTGGALVCNLVEMDQDHVKKTNVEEPVGQFTISQEMLTRGWDALQDFPLNVPEGIQDPKITIESTIRAHAHLQVPTPEPPPTPFWWACDHRVRKDWNDLTGPEKRLYLDAVNAAKTTPRKNQTDAGPGNNIYDTFVMIHEQTDNKEYAHQTAGFLAWHRKFLIEYESTLRSLGDAYKCVTIPYWDWTTETFGCMAHYSAESGLGAPGCDTYHAASQLLTDFGGPGDPTQTKEQGFSTHGDSGAGPVGCVTTGPFAGWVDHHSKCLSRGVNWNISAEGNKPFTGRVQMLKILAHTTYGNQASGDGFRVVLEGLPHGATHNYLGGHMRSFISPGDPIFFSHHAYIDKLWAVWQDCHDYDTQEVKTQLLQNPDAEENHKYYEHTKGYDKDGAGHAMPFFMMPNYDIGGTAMCPISGKGCIKTNYACARCVHRMDSWCQGGDWDDVCCSMCTQSRCADDCDARLPAYIDFNAVGSSLLKDWVTDESTPAHVISSTHMEGEGRNYIYAIDEIERSLLELAPEALGSCHIKGLESRLAATTTSRPATADGAADDQIEACTDDPSYIDKDGYACAGWKSYPCKDAANAGFTVAQKDELFAKCPLSCGTCTRRLSKASSSLVSETVFKETRRFHHTNTRRGHMARSYAEMIASSFKKAKCDMDSELQKAEVTRHTPTESSLVEGKQTEQAQKTQEHFQRAMQIAQDQECKIMATNGDYVGSYHCESDQARFFLPWLGPDTWHSIMENPELRSKVLCDPCCRKEDGSCAGLELAAVTGGK